ncbi:hypothetical protein Q3G72_017167 [Acer saccharum]|nr:hypothetical protein Q3G72_017167 [Acer saccharum]
MEGRRFQPRIRHRAASKSMEFKMKEGHAEMHSKKEQSFVEVLKGNKVMKGNQDSNAQVQKKRVQGSLKVLSMFWSRHQREEQWLRRCAVGVLKSFSNVESVNTRRRLDKGRVLVLVRQEEMVSVNVRVDMGNGFFTVSIKEEATQNQRGGKGEVGVGLIPRETIIGPHNGILSRSQSLDGSLKEYLENIEKAFVRANFKNGLDCQVNLREASDQSQKEGTSEDNSVLVVQETRASIETRKSEQEQESDGSGFSSISEQGRRVVSLMSQSD